jgi:hypothetical protein
MGSGLAAHGSSKAQISNSENNEQKEHAHPGRWIEKRLKRPKKDANPAVMAGGLENQA